MRSKITIHKSPRGDYIIDFAGRFGGGGSMPVGPDPAAAATKLGWAIGRYISTNPEGGDYTAPPEVLDLFAALTVDAAPDKGSRISYYASADALKAIQAERETTGASQSGAINSLVIRGSIQED